MNRRRVLAVMRKDIRAVVASKMVMVPMVVVPLIICMGMPALVSVIVFSAGTMMVSGAELIQRLIPAYPVPAAFSGLAEQMLYIFLNYTFVPLFMVLPLMAASIIAANSVVGEKEHKTLETLLYTPISNRELILAKLLGAFIPAVAISWVGFLGFFAVTNIISNLYRGMWIVRSWIWLPAVLLLSPSVSALGLAVTLAVSLKARTFMEAQQTSGAIVVPLIVLVAVQISGVVVFRPLYVVLLSAVLLGASYLVLVRVLPRFSRESIVSTL